MVQWHGHVLIKIVMEQRCHGMALMLRGARGCSEVREVRGVIRVDLVLKNLQHGLKCGAGLQGVRLNA